MLTSLRNEPHLGDILRRRRETLGWTIEIASKKSGIPEKQITAMETKTLFLFRSNVSLLDANLRIYGRRLGLNMQDHEELIGEMVGEIGPGNRHMTKLP